MDASGRCASCKFKLERSRRELARARVDCNERGCCEVAHAGILRHVSRTVSLACGRFHSLRLPSRRSTDRTDGRRARSLATSPLGTRPLGALRGIGATQCTLEIAPSGVVSRSCR